MRSLGDEVFGRKVLATVRATLCVSLALAMLVACSGRLNLENRNALAAEIANHAGFELIDFATAALPVRGWIRLPDREVFAQGSQTLVVYIEGDGFAWVRPDRQSVDPTPLNPLALRFATADPRLAVAYLGRPCQYVRCGNVREMRKYWGAARFSAEVIATYQPILDRLKQESGAAELELVGYSGGGAVALLLAARRDDVAQVVTVAGNLDTELFTRLHGVDAMSASLNPADEVQQLSALPQLHLVGEQDRIVPPDIARAYARKAGDAVALTLVVLPQGHHDWTGEAVWRARSKWR